MRNWDNHLCAFHGYLPSHGRKTQNNKVCLTFCFNRGWRYGTCGTTVIKKCIHNPTFEPRKLVTGDVRKGCKLVLAVSFVTAPLPCKLESLSKTSQFQNPPFHNRSVPSWEEQSVWMRDHTVVALVHLKSR